MYQIDSVKEMKEFAFWIADKLTNSSKKKKALILALSGDLGSGKTAFAQYFLQAFGVKGKITSPTFVLIKNYKLKTGNYKKAYHIDCYRIKRAGDFIFNLKDILNSSENIVLIEWPERINKVLPSDAIRLKFKHGKNINQRLVKFV